MRITTKSITFTALLAAIICVLSPIAVNIGPIPLSFGSLAVYIAASLIDKKHGTIAVLVFILLGAFGVPVFTGWTGGFWKIAGPTGGYILGYLPCAFIVGLFVDRCEKRLWAYPVGMIAGTAALYAFGTVWYMIYAEVDLATALAFCVVPFLLGDAIKIVAASALCCRLRLLLKKVISPAAVKKKKAPAAAAPSDNAEPPDNSAGDK